MELNLQKALLAEFIGTFALIFLGAGAGALGSGGLIGVALAHGFVVVGFAYSFGHLSGTHINPAVTLGLWVAKKIDGGPALAYIAAQLGGGVLGAYALRFVLGGVVGGLGVTALAEGLEVGGATISITPAMGLFVEAILTFLLATAVLNAAVSGKAGSLGGLAVGLTLIALILLGGPLTGASLNPARTLGPALAATDFRDFWLYMVGPVAGAMLAGLLYRGILEERGD